MTVPWHDGAPYLTPTQVLAIYRTRRVSDLAHVYRIAYQQVWRSIRTGTRTAYHAWDVDAYFNPDDYERRADVDGRLRPIPRSDTLPRKVGMSVGEHSPDDQHQHGDACPEPGCSDEETP